MAERSVAVALRAEVAGYVAGIKSAAAETRSFMGELDKSSKKKQALADLGSTAGKVGLAAAAGLGAIIATTANFDAKMSEVQAATGETAAAMDDLRDAAIQAGADTAFSAGEAADGIRELAKAGVATTDILDGGLDGALALAAAGQIGVGEAAEYSAKAMTMFNLEGSQVPHVADLLAAAAGKAVGEVGDFGQALNQAGLVASQTGLSIEDTIGTLAAFAQAGLAGSDAGTAFKSMLQRLQNPIGLGAKAMANFGISAYDVQGNFVGITDVADQLQDKLAGVDQATRDAAMAQIFGSDAVRAATVLYKEGGDGIQEWIDQTNDAGFAAETAATKLDNLKGDLEAFMGSMETAMIGAGEGSQGMLRRMVQGATDAVNKFNELSPAAQSVATGFLAITAVTGGGLWFGSKVIRGVSDTHKALNDLGFSAKGAARGLAGVGLAAGAIYATNRAIGALEDAMSDAVPGVESLTESLLNLNDAEVARQLRKDLGDVGAALDRVTDPGMRAQAFDWMHNAGTQVGFLASLAEKAAGSMGDFGAEMALSAEEAEAVADAVDGAMARIASTGGVEAAEKALDDLATTYGLTADEVDLLVSMMPQYEEALAGISNDAKLAAGATDGLGDAAGDAEGPIDDLTGAIEGAAEATYTWDDALDSIFSKLDKAAAGDAWKSGLKDLAEELKPKGGLSSGTDKGMANREEIRSQVELLETHARAVAETTSNGVKVVKTILAGRDAIIEQAKAAGIAEEDIRDYLKELGLTPDEIATAVTLPGVLTAQEQIRALGELYDLTPKEVRTLIEQTNMDSSQSRIKHLAELYDLTPKEIRTIVELQGHLEATQSIRAVRDAALAASGTYDITFQYLTTGHKPAKPGLPATAEADGGIVQAYANGGLAREPMIVKGGANILWAEPETGWEAYISGKPGMRDRNIGVLNEAARRLGVTMGNHAATGSGGTSRGGGRTMPLEVRGTLSIDESGKAYIRGIAEDVQSDASTFADTTGRMYS